MTPFRIVALALFMILVAALPAAAQEPSSTVAYTAEMRELLRGAEAGELKAMHELGFRLMDNRAAPYHDDAAGYFWLTQAADRGYWLSSFYLARAILYGWRSPGHENTDAENEEGLRWLRRAAQDVDPGEGSGKFNMLGKLHAGQTRGALSMVTVALDYEESAKWYRLCAIEGEPWCQAALGQILVYRLGRPETKREGCEWLAQGSENGHPTAMFELGGALRSGLCGRVDPKQAYVWLRRAEIWHQRGVCKDSDPYFTTAEVVQELAAGMDSTMTAAAEQLAEDWHPHPGMCWQP
jgi:TPR repeat protein